MAIFHLHIRSGSRSNGACAERKARAILEGSDPREDERIIATGHAHLPRWAGNDAVEVFRGADRWERANGRLYIEIVGALPNELDDAANRRIVTRFTEHASNGRLPILWSQRQGADPGPNRKRNPHFRMLINERINDGISRSESGWFRRAAPGTPQRGGAPKDRSVKASGWVRRTRHAYAEIVNEALSAAGRAERVTASSHKSRADEARARGDEAAAVTLERNPPKRRIGSAAAHIERGRPGRPAQQSARGEAERVRQRRIRELREELEAIDNELERLRAENGKQGPGQPIPREH